MIEVHESQSVVHSTPFRTLSFFFRCPGLDREVTLVLPSAGYYTSEYLSIYRPELSLNRPRISVVKGISAYTFEDKIRNKLWSKDPKVKTISSTTDSEGQAEVVAVI